MCPCSDLFRFMSRQSGLSFNGRKRELNASAFRLTKSEHPKMLTDTAISHFTTKGFRFVLVQRRKKNATDDFWFTFACFHVHYSWFPFAHSCLSCYSFGRNIKMKFIASIKGQKDDRLKIWFKVFLELQPNNIKHTASDRIKNGLSQ